MSSIIDSLSQFLSANSITLTQKHLYAFKRNLAKSLGYLPKDSQLREAYLELVADGRLPADQSLDQLLTTRRIRTESGVTPFAVMTKPFYCPGQCTFCPLELGMPKSYLSDEPAAARARQLKFDPAAQISSRLTQLVATGHDTDKIELIVIGGTFGNYPAEYKREFFKAMIDTVNGVVSPTLEEVQIYNESAPRRIVGISVETRPDWIDEEEVKLFRELGVTKVQVGVQAFDEQILKRIKRGHSLEAVAESTRLLKDAGIKVCYHYMPNLPGSSPEKDLEMARLMYEDERFKPDFVKIYPAQVIEGTELYREWQRGEYQSYSDELLKQVLKDIKKLTPPFVRIDRLVRDISKKWVSAGTKATNMRQLIHEEMRSEGWTCRCIRCREARGLPVPKSVKLVNLPILTLGGHEHLLTFEDHDHLYSLLRLRLPDLSSAALFPELEGAAIIREVHTYGTTVPVGRAGEGGKSQHQGLGRSLIKSAEQITAKAGYDKIAVIASIGTRGYYRKLGYERIGWYMLKSLL